MANEFGTIFSNNGTPNTRKIGEFTEIFLSEKGKSKNVVSLRISLAFNFEEIFSIG